MSDQANSVQDGRWTYILLDPVLQEDGSLPLIQKLSAGPAESFEYGLLVPGSGYEKYH